MTPKHLSLLIALIAALGPWGAAFIAAAQPLAPPVVVVPVIVLVESD